MLRVAVILCTFNGEKYIVEQLNSILNQSSVKIDVYIFDDNSTDKTVELIRPFVNDNQVFLEVNQINSGSAAVNFLNSLFRVYSFGKDYDFYAFSDQDDVWSQCKILQSTLEIQMKNLDLYASDLKVFSDSGESFIKKSYRSTTYSYYFESLSAGCTYVMSPKLVSRIILIRGITFSKYFSHDWFIFYLCNISNLAYYCDSVSNIQYRIHDNNVFGPMSLGGFNSFLIKLNFFFDDYFSKVWSDFLILTKDQNTERSLQSLISLESTSFFKFCFINIFNFSKSKPKSVILASYLIYYRVLKKWQT